jgi:hypothetical protein
MSTEWKAVLGYSRDPNGEWTIEAKCGDGKRRTIARFHSGFEAHVGNDPEQDAKLACAAVNALQGNPW